MSIKLTGFEAGEGKHLVVLHGLFGSARNWNTVAKRLGAQHHVHALDMRNHGNTRRDFLQNEEPGARESLDLALSPIGLWRRLRQNHRRYIRAL